MENANITAIRKKRNKHIAENRIPVSLTSLVCKILESIVRDALIKFMKENRLFQWQTIWFPWGKVHDHTARGGYVDVYCDFMKAFDTVLYGRLIQGPRPLWSWWLSGKIDKGLSHEQKTKLW